VDTPELGIAELLRAVDAGAPLLLLDLRNADEVAAWRVEGRRPIATLHVPYFDFVEDPDAAIARVPRGRDVVAICAKGGSSAMVVDLLREAGVPARNVAGGMVAYGEHLEPVRVAAPYALWQVNRRGKGCLSYVLVAGGEALVVDPSRDVAWYERFVAAQGARVVAVVDTHVHADHLSGAAALAARSGVAYAPPVDAPAGGTIRVGDVVVEIVATPGHTPGSTAYRIGGHLLSGDTLFVRGVGRPDLGDRAEEWARALHRTLHGAIAALPGDTVVLPAHAAGVEDIGPDGVVGVTLAVLRAMPELGLASEDAFVAAITARVAPPPAAYADIVRANLGLVAVAPETATEWELGRNECASARSD
jgi:glyoxylase-like metal-dependent hydrolase (beta-lactamase superfamily II)/rhodanese-related sulfurtransferase